MILTTLFLENELIIPMSKINTIFIPGGPWISGEYWDEYIKNSHIQNNTNRFHLLNHETSYNKHAEVNLQKTILHLLTEINKNSNKVEIVAHSYGAWLALLALNHEFCINVSKITLVSMPFTLERSAQMQNKIREIAINPIETNKDFSEFFSKIFHLYFFDRDTAKKYLYFTNKSFKEGNEKQLLTSIDLEKCINFIAKNNYRINFIYGENDIITNGSWEDKGLINVETIPNCGHFPMLERPESFTNLFKTM